VLLEVTEEEEAKTRLESTERRQREALEGALVIPWSETIHPETGSENYTYIGPQAFDIMGYTPAELMAEPNHFPRMVHPDDREHVQEAVDRSERTGLWEDTYRIFRRDGEIRWLHSVGRRASAPGLVPELWHGVAIDVTASRAENETPAETENETDRLPVTDPAAGG
jgi:PAS domain S-box-containing protein